MQVSEHMGTGRSAPVYHFYGRALRLSGDRGPVITGVVAISNTKATGLYGSISAFVPFDISLNAEGPNTGLFFRHLAFWYDRENNIGNIINNSEQLTLTDYVDRARSEFTPARLWIPLGRVAIDSEKIVVINELLDAAEAGMPRFLIFLASKSKEEPGRPLRRNVATIFRDVPRAFNFLAREAEEWLMAAGVNPLVSRITPEDIDPRLVGVNFMRAPETAWPLWMERAGRDNLPPFLRTNLFASSLTATP
ncbi:MAG: hypothetical protein WC901_00235 [Candidatus Margulisiibacteriota bacterium]